MSYRAAEEAQLLAEEKWIIDALTKIRLQRNSLQIERLQLESLKSKFLQKSNNSTKNQESEAQEPSTSKSNSVPFSRSGNTIAFEIPAITEASCNEEPLNLAVTKSVFAQDYSIENMEEYDDDDGECENIVIDINMLMESNQQG